jgi:hypothetical protein
MPAQDAELLICHLVLLGVLRQEFASTAYATNVYIKTGPQAAAVAAQRLAVALPLRLQAAKATGTRKRKAASKPESDEEAEPEAACEEEEAAGAAAACDDDDDDDAFEED